MVLNIYSVFDKRSDIFATPFFSHNDNTAFRSFHQLRADENSLVSRYPNDFSLFGLGTFDDLTGFITYCDPYLVLEDIPHENS